MISFGRIAIKCLEFPLYSKSLKEVTNIGQSSAGPSTARVHISSDTVGVPPVHLPIPGLAPEQRFQTEFSVFLPAGDYTTFALADAFDAVNEENETNNQAQEQFTLLP